MLTTMITASSWSCRGRAVCAMESYTAMTDGLRMRKLPLSIGGAAVYRRSKRLEQRFSLVDRFDEPYHLWQRSALGHTLLPRAVCPVPADDRRIAGPPISVKAAFKPRNAEQARVVFEANYHLSRGVSFILQATTGFGKTVVCAPLIASMGRKTLVIVPKSDLMRQWRLEMNKFLPGARIGMIWQDKYDVKDKDVVLASLKSIAIPGRYPDRMAEEFGFVIWDEVHRVPAATFAPTAMMFPALLRMGLSATPERMDGREVLIQANIGEVAVRTQFQTMKPKVALYASPWRLPKGMTVTPGKLGHVLRSLARNPYRNQMLLRLIAAGYTKGRRTVVFADSIDHLETLRALAIQEGVPVADTTLYISTAKKAEKEKAPAKRLIFATYGMMAEGTDIPWLDLGIMATPRANVTQPLGRILREWEGKPQPVWVDMVDDSSGVLFGYACKRQRLYSEIRADVVDYR